MSGGHFDYDQYKIGRIADEIELVIENNDSEEVNSWGDKVGYGFTEETILEFKRAVEYLRIAQVYATRIDWLLSGDDGEDTFIERLRKEIDQYQIQINLKYLGGNESE